MKMIEEFSVSGKYGNDPIKGKVTTYTNNLKKATKKGVKTSIISSWKNIKGRNNTTIYNKELLKKIGAALIIGTVTMTSLTGCQISPSSKTEIVAQETIRVEYTVKPGDSLWRIATLYSNDAQNEIYRISELNNMKDEDILIDGQIIKIDVPITSTYFADEIKNIKQNSEVIEWDAKEYYIYKAFDVPESEIHPDNKNYWVVKDEVFDMLAQAKIAREGLAELEIYNFQDQIAEKKVSINNSYNEAVRITENITGKVFDLKNALEGYNNYLKLDETNTKSK